MAIRRAEVSDVEAICELVKSLSHFYLNDKSADLPVWFSDTLTPQAFVNRVESTAYHNFVFEQNNEVIGYIAFRGDSHLYHLFVSENHQGKGISRRLWQYAITHCTANTYTLRSSLYAVPIYQKFGFEKVGDAEEKEGIGFQSMQLTLA